MVLAGLLEPVYDNGGDAFDYAINDRILHLAVFDAMGHGLAAAGVAAFAISAYRNSRLGGHEPAPETLRRLRQALMGRERARLRDDATALLVEWRRDGEWRFMPDTVA